MTFKEDGKEMQEFCIHLRGLEENVTSLLEDLEDKILKDSKTMWFYRTKRKLSTAMYYNGKVTAYGNIKIKLKEILKY